VAQNLTHALRLLQGAMQRVALALCAALAAALTGYTIACAASLAPWLVLPLTFGNTVYPDAGMGVQIGITALAAALVFFLPTNARVMALETSHRRFHIGMQDVARAYHVAHAADREGVFTLSSEFDSIRERLAFLRDHPDLAELEPSVLEVAAQMSHVSRELADLYSTRNVARARDFLIQRQQEIEEFERRIGEAKAVADEIRRWAGRVEIDESVAWSQLERLAEDLRLILPELDPQEELAETPERQESDPMPSDGMDEAWEHLEAPANDDRIVALLSRRAAE
jgi:hypothetical protein